VDGDVFAAAAGEKSKAEANQEADGGLRHEYRS
jgi:hypothetical protein